MGDNEANSSHLCFSIDSIFVTCMEFEKGIHVYCMELTSKITFQHILFEPQLASFWLKYIMFQACKKGLTKATH